MALDVGGAVFGRAPWASEPRTLEQLLGRPAWLRDALCREHPSLRFVPDRGDDVGALRRVCESCLVREECLDYALADENLAGVWGGTTEGERDAYRRERARPSRGR